MNFEKNQIRMLTKNQIRISVFITLATLFLALPLKAQVTIGALDEPDPSAVLELRSNDKFGLLLPRVALTSTTSFLPLQAHVAGMFIYNTATAGDVTPGVYYNDGAKWIRSEGNGSEWFYMPSFNLPVTAVGTGLTFNLYDEYQKQFTKSGNTQFVSSNAAVATATEKQLYTASQLDYVVTAYPASVLKINSIAADGTMNYDVLSTNIPEGSFINVVFVVK